MNTHVQKNVAAAKSEFSTLYKLYRDDVVRFDCGNALAQYINSDLGRTAQRLNELAEFLEMNDPNFPRTWSPL